MKVIKRPWILCRSVQNRPTEGNICSISPLSPTPTVSWYGKRSPLSTGLRSFNRIVVCFGGNPLFFADIHIYGRIPDLHHQDAELGSHRAVKLAKPLNYDHVIRMWVLTLCQVGSMLTRRGWHRDPAQPLSPSELLSAAAGSRCDTPRLAQPNPGQPAQSG